MAEQPSTFVITELGTLRVATIDGDVDMASADHFERALKKALGTADVVIDLSACGFLDSAGLRSLVSAAREATRQGHGLALAAPTPEVTKLLGLTGISDAIPTHGSVEEAAQRLTESPPPSRG